MWTKRKLLGAALGSAASGCIPRPCPPPAPFIGVPADSLIDAHAHLFNSKDLSCVRFISIVIAKQYPQLAEASLFPEDPTLLDQVVMAALWVVQAERAPSARHEHAVLGQIVTLPPGGEDASPTKPAEDQAASIERLSGLLQARPGEPDNQRGETGLRALASLAGGRPVPLDGSEPPALAPSDADEVARRAILGWESLAITAPAAASFNLPGLFSFIGNLRRYRHCLVDELVNIHASSGQSAVMLAPAMVDFGRWLRDDPAERSTFVDQIRTWHIISRRSGPAAVHGYVGFCPLRQVQFQRDRFGSGPGKINTPCSHDPLQVVREALTERGFLGVKLYPPMGFSASRNAGRDLSTHPFPQDVLDDTFGEAVASADVERRSRELGQELDEALTDLFDLCVSLAAPVMAHGGNSISANERTGELASPVYWDDVMDRIRPPSVLLAHFGGFTDAIDDGADEPGRPRDACSTDGRPSLARTWESRIIRRFIARPQQPLFADISYWADLLDDDCMELTLADLRSFSEDERRAMSQRLIFGSDWVMLAQEGRLNTYGSRVRALLQDLFGSGADDVMKNNFLRYAQLYPGSRAFDRLEESYAGVPHLRDRLVRACSI